MNSSDNPLVSNQLPVSEYVPKDPEELTDFLDGHLKKVSQSVNSRESGLYLLQETASFKSLYVVNNPQKRRNVYRYCMDVVNQQGGNLVASTTYTFPHGITGMKDCVYIGGGATDTSGRRKPIPFVTTVAAAQVEVHATTTNIVVALGSSAATLTQCFVVFEYTKD